MRTQSESSYRRIWIFFAISLCIAIAYGYYAIQATKKKHDSLLLQQELLSKDVNQLIYDIKDVRLRSSYPSLLYQRDLNDDESITDDLLQQNPAKDLSQYLSARRAQKIFTDFVNQNKLIDTLSHTNELELEMDEAVLVGRYKGKLLFGLRAIVNSENTIDGFLLKNHSSNDERVYTKINLVMKTIDELYTEIKANYSQSTLYRNYISEYLTKSAISLNQQGYYVTSVTNQDGYVWTFFNSFRRAIARLSLDPYTSKFRLGNIFLTINSLEQIEGKILQPFLIDSINPNLVSENTPALKKLSELLSTESSQKNFEKHGLIISNKYNVENDEYVYPVFENTKQVGVLAVDKEDSMVLLKDSSGFPIKYYGTLNEFLSTRSLDTGITAESKEVYSMFLIGTNDGLADTIIYASINSDSQISFISIPRDLYFKGQRINWYFARYSKEKFFKLIELLLGLKAEHYAHIDMFALKDIVDTLGEVSVTLSTPLVDPSYKIYKNGIWSTLYYEAGEHLMDGTEVLRIVRSRYSSSDFSRSQRQMLVLMSLFLHIQAQIKNKPANLVPITKTILRYLDTNLTLGELTNLYRSHHDFVLANTLILQTDNILESTYSNLLEANLNRDDVDEDYDLGAWILIPKDNNWKKLKIFVQNHINSY